MTARAVAVTVVLTPSPGRGDEVLELVRGAFARIRAEQPEALVLTAHVDPQSEDLMLYELWTDEDVFDRFLERPEMVDYLRELDGLLTSRRLCRWTPTSA